MPTHKILCGFCTKVTGEIELAPEYEGQQFTDKDLGIADSRCEVHEAMHGSYKKMRQDFEQKLGGTQQEFEAIMLEAEGKRGNFDTIVARKVEAIKTAEAVALPII